MLIFIRKLLMSLLSFIENANLEAIKAAVTKNRELLFQNIGEGTMLSHAAWRGHLDIVSFLIEQGAAINDQTNPSAQTPLMRAASYGHLNVVDYLLKRPDINPNLQSRSGKTALQYVLTEDNDDIKYFLTAQRLLDAKVIIDFEGAPKLSLILAKNEKMFNLLISHKPNLDIKDEEGNTALLNLCKSSRKNSLQSIQLLIDEGADVTVVNKDGNSTLMLVEKTSKYALAKIRILLDAGARVDHVNSSGKTVFSDPDHCSIELLNLLLEAAVKQQINVPSYIIWIYFKQRDWEKVISLLKQLPLEEREQLIDKNGSTLLGCAINELGDKLPEELLTLYNLNVINPNQNSYLSVALQKNCLATAAKLLTLGADIDEKDGEGKTLLMKFLSAGNDTAVRFLLEHGADVNVISKKNYTALTLCVNKYKMLKFLPLLLQDNLTINHFNHEEMTALYILVCEANDDLAHKETYIQAMKLFIDMGADKTLSCGVWKRSPLKTALICYRTFLENYEPVEKAPKSPKFYQSASKLLHFQPKPEKETEVTCMEMTDENDLYAESSLQ